MSHYWRAENYYRNHRPEKGLVDPSTQLEGITWQKLKNGNIRVSIIEKDEEKPILSVTCLFPDALEPSILEEISLNLVDIEKEGTKLFRGPKYFGIKQKPNEHNNNSGIEKKFLVLFKNEGDAESFLLVAGNYIHVGNSVDNECISPSQIKISQENLSNPINNSSSYATLSINDDKYNFDIDAISDDDLRSWFLKAIMSTEFRYLIQEASSTEKPSPPRSHHKRKSDSL